jgi:hypothetical protein
MASRAQQASVGLGQLTLDVGGDVAIALVARVVAVNIEDKYDAHGNVVETIRKHVLRVDEQSAKIKEAEAFTVAPDEPPAED